MSTLYLSAPNLRQNSVTQALESLGLPTLGISLNDQAYAAEIPEDLPLPKDLIHERLNPLAKELAFDFALLETEFTADRFKLLTMDMDSTLITIECIDEIADYAGKKAEVAAITEAAMRGEITNFTDSLYQRVALLKGVPASALEAVFSERLQFSPGARNLIAFAKKNGWKTLLVSGGFTFFTDRIREILELDFSRANTLEIVDGQLTGRVLGDVVDGEAKKATLIKTCHNLGIQPEQCIAMGDGANDLPMMSVAGASVAYRAKPTVQAQTDFQINFGGLDTLANWLSQ